MRRVIFTVPGIRSIPGDAKNWCGRAVTWLHTKTSEIITAEKIEYFTAAVLRPFGQRDRSDKLVRTASYYDNAIWRKDVVAHSNGTDVVTDALKQDPALRFHTVHLVCAACEADFWKNGLNQCLREGRIRWVRVYVATDDKALKFAASWFAKKILGYGTLGRRGPCRVAAEVAGRVETVEWNGYGHSTCWDDEHFDDTMKLFV